MSCGPECAVRCCGPEQHCSNRLRESGEYLKMIERLLARGMWRKFIIPCLDQIFKRLTAALGGVF